MLGQNLTVSVSESRRVREQLSRDDILSGLTRSKLLSWIPPAIDSQDVMPIVTANVPLGPDVVSWMQQATAILSVLQTAQESYHKAGSNLAVASGDAYSPGVSTTGIYAVSTNGNTVRSQGFGQCVIGGQTFSVPLDQKLTLLGRNFLGWASIPSRGSGIQWIMALLNWLELARTPITSKIPFPSVSGDNATGLVAPQFVMVSTSIPTPVHQLFLSIQSDKPQTMIVKGRSAGDYTAELFNVSLTVPEGESAFTVFVRGLPVVPPYVLHMQPEDQTNTALVSASTRPM